MRNILFLWLAFSCFFACSDDNEGGFDVPVEFRRPLDFQAIPGGAVMKYQLSDDTDIFGVRVRYTNAWGEEITKDASYLADSILLDGFKEAETNKLAWLTFFNKNMEESEPLEITFNTEKSATLAVFDNLQVRSFWNGFNVTYTAPEIVSGILYVFYVGTNPLTHELDSIQVASVPIVEGGDTLNFPLSQVLDEIKVVVRTDELKGYRVKQEIHTVPCLTMKTLNPNEFDFKFTGGIIENQEYQFGKEYLFDGDKKGTRYRKNRMEGNTYKYATFMTESGAFGERFIIDLGEAKVPAAVRLYANLYYGGEYPYQNPSQPFASAVWCGTYPSRLPCKIALYGTNDDPETVPLSGCVRLYELDYPPTNTDAKGPFHDSWAAYSDFAGYSNWDIWGYGPSYLTATDEELEAAEPVLLEMLCNYTGEEYRYLFFIVEDTFNSTRYSYYYPDGYEENPEEYVTFAEMEVSVKAE